MRALVVVLGVLLGLLGTAVGTAAPARVALPAPSGPLPVGTTTLDLVDPARADPWRPEERRELLVSLWYPALPGGKPARYVTPAESAATVEALGIPLPPDTLTRVRVAARAEAPALPSPRGWPLVLLSPGAGNSRNTLTALAEQLASKGFVVAGIDHAHEANNVEFPGGRMLTCLPCGMTNPNPWPAATANRARDVSFVLDRLLARNSWFIDPSRIGMAGHSAGGSATAAAMAADRRVRAGVNFDGPLFEVHGLDRPLALLSSPIGTESFGDTWRAAWPEVTGWQQWLLLTGSGHSSATDNGVLVDRLGLRDRLPPRLIANQYGDIDSGYALGLARDYLTAMFDHHLRGIPSPLLENPTARYPELRKVQG
ncbi:alpha/beta hydrolase family protein [Amycolatopsis anabasis]|uniref:alpha/beta hydrolase family protein n=1 Tax=Amycolatopsis anabasis TaxID=1840409 RepID=UPI00131DE3F3|nr:prolyl oligopeptidase family serine peptidase [Amycolatopsis anabasis]